MNKLPVGCGWAFALNCMNVVLEKSCEDADLQARHGKFWPEKAVLEKFKNSVDTGTGVS